MNNDNEVLGTYWIRRKIEVRADSPELEELLSAATPFGFDDKSGIAGITGEKLDTLLAARQEQLREEAERRLSGLDDDALVEECRSASYSESRLASEVLVERVNNGQGNAFVALVNAIDPTSEPFNYPFNEILTSLVAPKRVAVKTLGIKQLTALVTDGGSSPMSFAAKERLDFLAKRKRRLQAVRSGPLQEVIARFNAGDFDDDKHVKKTALERVRKETVSERQLRDLLPPMTPEELKEYLKGLDVPSPGYLSCCSPTMRGTLWDAELAMKQIKYSPARLLKRARTEFGGRLPEALHTAMALAPHDRYQHEYIEWLSGLSRSSVERDEDPVASSGKDS